MFKQFVNTTFKVSLRPMSGISVHKFKPTNTQKRILVWTKKFKTMDEVPEYISLDMIERARSKLRIKVANIMMLVTALASLGAILSGKAAAKRGESVQQHNLDWHKKYAEDYEKEKSSSGNNNDAVNK